MLALGGVLAVSAFSWLSLALLSAPHHGDGIMRMVMPETTVAPSRQFAAALLMWTVMMVAMMLPTAVRAIDVFGRFAANRRSATGSAPAISLFVSGYVAVWSAFSVLAAAGQGVLSRASLLTPALQSSSILLSAALLTLAGVFQFTPLKDACLTQCRSPFPFFLANWRDGDLGAFLLGLRHGSYCVGCCWALMGLMFVFGSMNLLWMGALSLFMLSEKMAPANWRLHQGAGVFSMLWGLFLATRLLG